MRIALGDAPAPAPYSREALIACGVDPDAINPATGRPNSFYPGALPAEILRHCQEAWNVAVSLPYGETGPEFYVNPEGTIGRPAEPLAQALIEAAAANPGQPVAVTTPVLERATQIAQSTTASKSTALWLGGALVAGVLLLRR